MSTDPISIGDALATRLRQFRAERGWSQGDLGRRMRLLGFAWTRMTVTEVESPRRRRRLTFEEVFALASVFAIPVTEFLRPPTGAVVQLSDTSKLSAADFSALLVAGGLDEDSEEAKARAELNRATEQADRLTVEWDEAIVRRDHAQRQLDRVLGLLDEEQEPSGKGPRK